MHRGKHPRLATRLAKAYAAKAHNAVSQTNVLEHCVVAHCFDQDTPGGPVQPNFAARAGKSTRSTGVHGCSLGDTHMQAMTQQDV